MLGIFSLFATKTRIYQQRKSIEFSISVPIYFVCTLKKFPKFYFFLNFEAEFHICFSIAIVDMFENLICDHMCRSDFGIFHCNLNIDLL